ncbi:DUF3025 domain-containing protein [Hydrogenophaga sp. RWCD_12]|uniref:DUF3025 domain-containing protein n=1 Tax=Hydrogenophaga sp. RWCD_12 TaxID=3391190 RepID=UPI00398476C1
MCAVGNAVAGWPAPDWSQPWNAPFADVGSAVRAACEAGLALSVALTQCIGAAGPRFVPQAELPEGMAYEQFIFDTGAVPTREGLHDFFNGLVWKRFPATKRRLNRLQAAEIEAAGVGQVRGAVRDAITLFDENAVLLQAPDALWEALIAREWTRLFVDLRPLWAQARLVGFGHALLEKLVAPYKSVTGHVYRAPVPPELGDDLAAWDDWLAARLTASELAAKPFTPLPVLGVPGWWPGNQDPAFYDDAHVFRPMRPTLES